MIRRSARAITGRWSPGVSKNYGSDYTLTKLAAGMAKVHYPGLVLPAAMSATSSVLYRSDGNWPQ